MRNRGTGAQGAPGLSATQAAIVKELAGQDTRVMAETFLLEVATPEKLLVREQASEAQIPAANGYVGILPGHAALLAELGAGELSYAAGGRRHSLTVSGGWLEVASDHVRVLADGAE